MSYPISVVDHRALDTDYDGVVFVSDIDKTYLSTRFSSAKYLARIPFEMAVDKRAIGGMPSLFRGIRRGVSRAFASTPLYFVSASPPQLRKVVERKMTLDGVDFDGFTFKDWFGLVKGANPRAIVDHIGFKLAALLDGRRRRPNSHEFLLGDDVEQDPLAYVTYASILRGRLDPNELVDVLRTHGVPNTFAEDIALAARDVHAAPGVVERMFILRQKGRDLSLLASSDPSLVSVSDSFQLSLALFSLERVDARTVHDVALELTQQHAFGKHDLSVAIEDSVNRGLIDAQGVSTLGF